MKKLLALIGLAVSLLASPTKTQAIGGCSLTWTPNLTFFWSGGSVNVRQANGGSYWVTGNSAYNGAQYSLGEGDYVYIIPPNCAVWTWGYTSFCVCDNHGNEVCGNPTAQTLGGAIYQQREVLMDCQCPNGGSSWSFIFVFQKYCQLPPNGQ
jgi:hypothetical protein